MVLSEYEGYDCWQHTKSCYSKIDWNIPKYTTSFTSTNVDQVQNWLKPVKYIIKCKNVFYLCFK